MKTRTYRIQRAAELSGLTADLIRAWERRYGILQPERTPGGYRVYTERDIHLLRRLKGLLSEGMAIGEAVQLVPQLSQELRAPPALGGEEGEDARLGAWRQALIDVAERMDTVRAEILLDTVLGSLQPLTAVDEVIVPVLHEMGERWAAGTFSVAQEHVISQVLRSRLISLLHVAPSGMRRAVVACFPEEQHEMGELVAALHLRHAGFQVTVLGQRTPTESVVHACQHLSPELVGISLIDDPGEAVLGAFLSEVRQAMPPGAVLWVGGAGAARHHALIAGAGVRRFEGQQDWRAFVA